jgi:hypothetical protein
MTSVKLFTIHGINTEGEWQEELRPIFEAHFSYQSIRYNGHRFLFGIPQILFSIGFGKAVASVIQQYDRHTRGNSARHYVIAHSYGTVISTFIMKKFHEVEFHRAIFLGSPLSSSFKWSSLKRDKFELVNEYGSADLAVRLARMIFWRKIIGNAGRVGFQGKDVHTIFSNENDIVALILRGVWHSVNDAWKFPDNKEKVKSLWPPLAVRRSIRALPWTRSDG